jgi:hypothetical protein
MRQLDPGQGTADVNVVARARKGRRTGYHVR